MATANLPLSPPNIYIVGAQSTGKTTLVNSLSQTFRSPLAANYYHGHRIAPPAILSEVARTVLRAHSFSATDIVTSPDRALELQRLILEAQDIAEAGCEQDWFVSDRSGVDAAVYAERYGGVRALETLMAEPSWARIVLRMRAALIVVCEAGCSWLVDDGVRLMPKDLEDWVAFHELFCSRLRSLQLQFEVLPRNLSDLDARVKFVMDRWHEKVSPYTVSGMSAA